MLNIFLLNVSLQMKSSQVLFVVLVALVANAQAALKDQSFTWVDVSAGVAGSVAICVMFVGVAFLTYELGCRNYAKELRSNGKPYTEIEFANGSAADRPITSKLDMVVDSVKDNGPPLYPSLTTSGAQVDMPDLE
ncbi:uncharacterized protein [Diadema antillarum]|uniref:uncharacterized protein n=1 Tax=Diadema antillarum TaxID=105358 RepID=UPI003A853F62